jgi:SET domain-containing protein
MSSIFKDRLYKHKGIEIRKSPNDGWGVFARRNIKKHSLLEEVPIIAVPYGKIVETEEVMRYTYGFSDGYLMFGFGFAGLYNHSFEPNADWMRDHVNMTMKHFAIKDISVGEEIFINYGEENIDFEVNSK